MANDLFGQPIADAHIDAIIMGVRRRRNWTKPGGYARTPGSGPQGETCKTCKHLCATGQSRKTFYKCGIIRHCWTGGIGTDILLKSPACSRWEKDDSNDKRPS